jgi:hypothetical protein
MRAHLSEHRRLRLLVIIAMGSFLAQGWLAQNACAKQEPPVTIEQMMTYLGFNTSFKKALLEGKILSTGMPEMEKSREELAVAAVMLVVKAPMEKVVGAYLDGESFRQSSDILEYRLIRSTEKGVHAAEEDFKPIGYTARESSEVEKLIDFKGGDVFNFSQGEIKQFEAIGQKDPHVRDKVSLVLRGILVERYPAMELTVAITSSKLLEERLPGFYQSVLKYPKEAGKGVKNEFYWFKNLLDNRPTFQLSHYMADISEHYGIVAELQFYVEHSYNSMFTLIGCVPYEGGTVVFCANRTFTVHVTGFGSSLKRSVGRHRIEDAVSSHFAKLRSVLESN